MSGDPYEEAEQQQRLEEAPLLVPGPAPKSRKIVVAGLLLAALLLALVIVANLAGLVNKPGSVEARPARKPTTMTRQQSESFAEQQSGQAAYLRGQDRDKNPRNNEDTVLGEAQGLARDAYEEVEGVPPRTKAQVEAEHGRGPDGRSGAKSEAEQRRESAALEARHRRQNDLDSSPLALDFSEYFDKQKEAVETAAPAASVAKVSTERPRAQAAEAVAQRELAQGEPAQRGLAQGEPADVESTEGEQKSRPRQAHNPAEDYSFDASFGKLYRLMEDTLLETVLVNRLNGASVGPVITMLTSDVYSASGAHLLIPKGSRLLGRLSAVGHVNQERLFVAFHRLIMPDGYSVSLDKFQGLDVVGQTGLRDLVNHHYLQIFGSSLALAAVSATAQIGNNSSFGTYDWGVQMRNGASEGLGQSAQRVLERFLNVLPTFTIRERTRVKVLLAGDLLLPDSRNHTMDPDL